MWIASVPTSPLGVFAVGVVAPLVVAGTALVVYRDARRVGLAHPLAWSAVVAGGLAATLALRLLASVPVPGALVFGVGGLALYLFERDDHLHGDEPADPRALAGRDDAADSPETDGAADSPETDDGR